MTRVVPLVRRLPNGDVYVRIASTLSFTIAPRLWERLVEAAERQEPVPAPVYAVAETRYTRYVVIPPFKASAENVEAAGVYMLKPMEPEEEEPPVHGGVEMYYATLELLRGNDAEAALEELRRLAGGMATILVESIQETPAVMEYVAINGRRVRIIHLPGAAYGQRLSGHGYAPIAVTLNPEPSPEPGDEQTVHWLMTKHGRGDFINSGTSHQLDISIY